LGRQAFIFGLQPYLSPDDLEAMTKPKRPRDTNQLAKFITDLATGEIQDKTDDGKNPAAVALGRLGGQKGGKARADSLTKSERSEIAKKAAKARWKR
jgi:hypothetical protein